MRGVQEPLRSGDSLPETPAGPPETPPPVPEAEVGAEPGVPEAVAGPEPVAAPVGAGAERQPAAAAVAAEPGPTARARVAVPEPDADEDMDADTDAGQAWGPPLTPREKVAQDVPLAATEIAHLLGVPECTVRNAAKDGRLARCGTLRQVSVFTWQAVREWLGASKVAAGGPGGGRDVG